MANFTPGCHEQREKREEWYDCRSLGHCDHLKDLRDNPFARKTGGGRRRRRGGGGCLEYIGGSSFYGPLDDKAEAGGETDKKLPFSVTQLSSGGERDHLRREREGERERKEGTFCI